MLLPGDAIIVAPVGNSALKVGMIVLYRSPWGDPIAHRIVQVGPETRGEPSVVIVRPDAAGSDEWVEVGSVLGQVIAMERGGKRRWLDRGRLSWAGMLRVRSRLGGLVLAAPSRVPRHVAARALPKLQRFRGYRRIAAFLADNRIRIRVAEQEDVPSLAAIYRWDDYCADSGNEASIIQQLRRLEPDQCHVVATLWNKPAGAVVLRRFPWNEELYPDWWLFDLIVRVRYRGMGIARGLVRTAIQEAGHRGAGRVNVIVERGNSAAHELYRELGFEPTSLPILEQKLLQDVSVGGPRRLVLSKALP